MERRSWRYLNGDSHARAMKLTGWASWARLVAGLHYAVGPARLTLSQYSKDFPI
jgi:hypothetical protein